jgi:hypothetical protein
MRLEKTAKGEGKTRKVVVNTVLVSWEGWALGGWKVPHHDAQGGQQTTMLWLLVHARLPGQDRMGRKGCTLYNRVAC